MKKDDEIRILEMDLYDHAILLRLVIDERNRLIRTGEISDEFNEMALRLARAPAKASLQKKKKMWWDR